MMDSFELWFIGRYGFTPVRKGFGYKDERVNGMWIRWLTKVKPLN